MSGNLEPFFSHHILAESEMMLALRIPIHLICSCSDNKDKQFLHKKRFTLRQQWQIWLSKLSFGQTLGNKKKMQTWDASTITAIEISSLIQHLQTP